MYLKRWAAGELSIHSLRSEEKPPLKNNIHSLIIYCIVRDFILCPFEKAASDKRIRMQDAKKKAFILRH